MKNIKLNISYVMAFLILMLSGVSINAEAYQKHDIKSMLLSEANKQNVSPSLVLAIARVESNFDAYAESHAGARGVMQIMPRTARTVFNTSADRLYDPRVNIRLGVRFIKQLINTYDGRVDIALSHYNGGSAVKDRYGNLRIIPATRSYVKNVLNYQRQYQLKGFDKAHTKSKRQTFARSAESNYLDDFSGPNSISKRKHSFTNESTTDLVKPLNITAAQKTEKLSATQQRIEALQKLRVHNLTRDQSFGQTRTTTLKPVSPIKNDKRAKIRQWESVYQ